MPDAIGFDVYGTLVDPLGMSQHLEAAAGRLAGQMARLWREKQIEYTFRRASAHSRIHCTSPSQKNPMCMPKTSVPFARVRMPT